MATIDASKAGYIIGISSGTFTTARQNGAAASTAPSTNSTLALRYRAYSGRGSLTHAFARTFLYFDTSGITGAVSSTSIDIVGYSAGLADCIVLKSSAFGGDGGTALATGDFYSEIDYSTPYSSEFSPWSSTGVNNITLNATANTDIQANNAFIVALVEHDYDYSDTPLGSAFDVPSGIAFGTTITLTYTEAAASGPANLTSYNGIAKANITSINGIAIANVTSINGIS